MAQIDLTLTNQDLDQDYADRKRRELDAEWAAYVKAGQAEQAAAAPTPTADTSSPLDILKKGAEATVATATEGAKNLVGGPIRDLTGQGGGVGQSVVGLMQLLSALPAGAGAAVQEAMRQYTPGAEAAVAIPGGQNSIAGYLRTVLSAPQLLLDPAASEQPIETAEALNQDMTFGELINTLTQVATTGPLNRAKMAAAKGAVKAAVRGAEHMKSFALEGLPAPKAGEVRLYRGEGIPAGQPLPDWITQGLKESGALDARGRWFTDRKDIAEWYVREAGEAGRMTYVDVPAAVRDSTRVAAQGGDPAKFSLDPEREFFLPKDLAGKAKPIPGSIIEQAKKAAMSERGSIGPQPPPEPAKTSSMGPEPRPEAMALRETPTAPGGAGKPPGEAPKAPPGAPGGAATPTDVGQARINVERLQANADVKGTAAAINALQTERLAAGRKTRTHSDLQKKASDLGLTVERAMAIDPAAIALGEAEVYQQAFRDLNLAASAHVDALAGRVLAGDKGAQGALFDAFTVAGELSIRQEEFGRAFARGTEARRIMAEDQRALFDPAALADLRERISGEYEGDATLLAARLKSIKSEPQRATFVRQTVNAGRLGLNLAHTVWINFLLSNPQTHVANMAGTALMQLYEIPERAVAGVIGEASRGIEILRGQTPAEHVRVAETSAAIRAMAEGLRDGIRLAGMALSEAPDAPARMSPALRAASEQLLERTQLSDMKPLTAEAYGFDPATNFGRAVDALGSVGHTIAPTRLLGAEDAIFKGLAFRVELKALATREAMAQGLKGKDFARAVADMENEPPPQIMKQAIDAAFLRTLNAELGAMGQAITAAINETPGGRAIFPFVRTPANSGKYVFQRAPGTSLVSALNFINGENFKDVAAGGAARDRALARIALGHAVGAVIAYETMQGNFIGEGPTDPRLRRDFFAAPADDPKTPRRLRNSMKIGGEYISLERLDPVLGGMITATVNATEIIAQLPTPPPGADEELDEGLQMLAAVGVAASRVFVNKSSMKGLADILDAFAQPNRSAERVLKSFARSTVPGVVRQVQTRLVDENAVRDARSIISQVKSGVPGFASDVPPKVQRITGQPVYYPPGWGPDMVSPVAYGMDASDPVLDELVRNRVAISDWPDHLGGQPQSAGAIVAPTRTPGVRLSLGQIHRLATITTSEATINGMTQYDYLKALVASPSYQQQSDGPEGGKNLMLRSAIRNFLDLGTRKLRQEDKELDAALTAQGEARVNARLPITSPRSPQHPANQGQEDLIRSLAR